MSRLLGTGRQHIIAQLRGMSDESLCLNQATGCCALICHPSRNFQAVGTGGSEGGRAFAGGCIDNLARRKSNNSFFPGCQRFLENFSRGSLLIFTSSFLVFFSLPSHTLDKEFWHPGKERERKRTQKRVYRSSSSIEMSFSRCVKKA